MKKPTEQELKDIIERNINKMYCEIQEHIEQTDGGNASIFHSGSTIEQELFGYFTEYIEYEELYDD